MKDLESRSVSAPPVACPLQVSSLSDGNQNFSKSPASVATVSSSSAIAGVGTSVSVPISQGTQTDFDASNSATEAAPKGGSAVAAISSPSPIPVSELPANQSAGELDDTQQRIGTDFSRVGGVEGRAEEATEVRRDCFSQLDFKVQK